jgi:hypothetical protein
MAAPSSSVRNDYLCLTLLSSTASALAFLRYFFRGEILLYGDAVAHINIARRVFDSRTPGPLQLGTVWLPLPHMLTIPFIISGWAWRTGAGGSIVSMVAYVLGAIGVARFFWENRSHNRASTGPQRAAGWVAALLLLLNPNLLYLQSTAMTESLSLALFIWALVFYAEFTAALQRSRNVLISSAQQEVEAHRAGKSLIRCAFVLAAGMLTRYDFWFLAFVIWICALVKIFRPTAAKSAQKRALTNVIRKVWGKSALLIALVAALWLSYNFGQYGNALEFARGPYSAKAIAEKSAVAGRPPHPGYHDVRIAAIYYLKSAELNLANSKAQWLWIVVAAFGTMLLLSRGRTGIVVILWSPLIFYPLSIAYGGVPIFMPIWWPFSYYNVRYGLELLPAFVITTGSIISGIARLQKAPLQHVIQFAIVVLLFATYLQVERSVPICLREARVNSTTRIAFEQQLAAILTRLPPDAALLMYTGNHVGALESAGIPLRNAITESNYRIWQAALADPARYANFSIAMEGDPVWRAVHQHPAGLAAIAFIHVNGQPAAAIYESSSR